MSVGEVGLSPSIGTPTSPRVPRHVHQIWLGSDLPDEFARYADRWQELHPDWGYTLWTEQNLPKLRNQDLFDNAESLTVGNQWQLKSDIARYELLHLHGGVYCDTDFEPLRSIEPLIPDTATAFAAWEEQGTWIANGLMGAVQGHWFLDRLIAGLPDSIEEHRDKRPPHSAGPRYLTRMDERHQGLDHIIDQHAVLPYSYKDLPKIGRARPRDFPNATLVHHWNNQRTVRGFR